MSNGAYRLAGALGVAAVAALAGRRGSGTQVKMSAQQTAKLVDQVRGLFATKDRAYILQGLNLWKMLGQGKPLPLQGLQLNYTDLRGADLRGAHLAGAELWRADLKGADLTGADLWKASLGRADLRQAKLMGAILQSANLKRSKLHGANLAGADLRQANLAGAKYDRTTVWPSNVTIRATTVMEQS